jgi:hypothetical protein
VGLLFLFVHLYTFVLSFLCVLSFLWGIKIKKKKKEIKN